MGQAEDSISTASMPADRAQANQGVGKVPKPIPVSLRDTPVRNHGKSLSRMTSRQNRVRDQASLSRKHQTTRSHSVHTDDSLTENQSVSVKQGTTTIHEDSAAYWAIQAGLLTPLTFAQHRLSPLAAFTSGAYFLHSGRR